MYIALGFALATLLAAAIFPAIYRRAVRLTKEAILAVNPGTYAEVRAAQDFERATHAIEMRQVEEAMERERQTGARHRLEAGRLTAETIRLKAAHKKEIEALVKALDEAQTTSGGRKAKTKALAQELAQAKARLSDAEQELAGFKTESETTSAQDPAEDPRDPLVQTTIAGLELQVATLKAQLEKDGSKAVVTDPLLLTDSNDLRKIITSLEAELVDAETRFISAQAEVARLSAAMDPETPKGDDRISQLERDLKWAQDEKARLAALLKDRDRTLKRARDQVSDLRSDLAATLQASPAPAQSEGRTSEGPSAKPDVKTTSTNSDDTAAKAGNGTASANNPAVLDASALVNRIMRSGSAAPKKTTAAQDGETSQASQRQKASAKSEKTVSAATGSPRTKSSRAKNRDVA
ncbi:hypothetical protein [Roseibium sp.]|uniref:hypothetical protein n=1 Tax=Roseibium sp. TaxID=1936156 RepID=UPI003A984B62